MVSWCYKEILFKAKKICADISKQTKKGITNVYLINEQDQSESLTEDEMFNVITLLSLYILLTRSYV